MNRVLVSLFVLFCSMTSAFAALDDWVFGVGGGLGLQDGYQVQIEAEPALYHWLPREGVKFFVSYTVVRDRESFSLRDGCYGKPWWPGDGKPPWATDDFPSLHYDDRTLSKKDTDGYLFFGATYQFRIGR